MREPRLLGLGKLLIGLKKTLRNVSTRAVVENGCPFRGVPGTTLDSTLSKVDSAASAGLRVPDGLLLYDPLDPAQGRVGMDVDFLARVDAHPRVAG